MKKLVYLLAAGSMAFVACQNSPSYKVTGSVEDITEWVPIKFKKSKAKL